jgi:glutamine synthetase
LNTIVAEQMIKFKAEVDEMIEKGISRDAAIFNVVKSYIKASSAIRFEGNSYSDEWLEEAARRGLSNNSNTPDALPAFVSEKSVALFEKHNVLSRTELQARYEIKLEKYIKKIQIEARVLGDLAVNHILPTAIQYQNRLIENARGLQAVLDSKTYVQLSRNQLNTIKEISDHVASIKEGVVEMTEARTKANVIADTAEKAVAYRDTVLARFEEIRRHVDKLELLVDDNLWPLPKYRELLFIK